MMVQQLGNDGLLIYMAVDGGRALDHADIWYVASDGYMASDGSWFMVHISWGFAFIELVNLAGDVCATNQRVDAACQSHSQRGGPMSQGFGFTFRDFRG